MCVLGTPKDRIVKDRKEKERKKETTQNEKYGRANKKLAPIHDWFVGRVYLMHREFDNH